MIIPATDRFVTHAINQLEQGNAIAYPTDTIYGFGADATNKNAIEKINLMKNRETPLSIMVDTVDEINNFGHLDDMQKRILNRYLPGPYTFLIYNKRSSLSNKITMGSDKVAIRIPDNTFCKKLTSGFGPIVTTSVNIHKEPPINDPVVINNKFNNIYVYSDGAIDRSLSSTIVDISSGKLDILRQGQGAI